MKEIIIREIRPEEIPLLNDFLYEAIFIPEGVPAPPRSIIQQEDLQVYVRDFGKKADDRCLMAEVGGKVVGAVWTRIMNDYGHIADGIPSLAISLVKDYRHQGIGTELLREMLHLLRRDGYPQVSLSVQKANPAFRMYQKVGFEVLKETEEEYLMICNLKEPGLFRQALGKFLLGVIVVGLLLFLPAASLRYWQGWLLMGILFVPMFCAGLVMIIKNPDLLRKRLNAKEEEKEQKMVVKFSGLLFIAAFVVAGLNWRFGWCVLPGWAVWVSAGLFLICYLLYAEVLRENTYLSRTIEVQKNQKVIDTGLYGIVRHPMYMATTVLFLAMPLVLGSPLSFLIMLLYLPLIAKRIKNEEKVLEEGLEGYKEYKQKVKYKVIPFVW